MSAAVSLAAPQDQRLARIVVALRRWRERRQRERVLIADAILTHAGFSLREDPDGRAILVCPPLVGNVPCHAGSLSTHSHESRCPFPVCIEAAQKAHEAAHKKASKKRPRVPPCDPELAAMLGSFFASGVYINAIFREGRSQALPEQRPLPRVVRRFTPDERDTAIKLVQQRPIRWFVDREEMLSAFWLEFTNPTKRVASREMHLPFTKIVEKALQRAYATIRPKSDNDNT